MEESLHTSLEDTNIGSKNNAPLILFVLLFVALLFGAYWYLQSTPKAPQPQTTTQVQESPTNSPSLKSQESEVKIFRLSAADYRFSPSVLTVKVGEKVRVILTNDDKSAENARFKMKHDFVLDEFDVLSDEAGEGETVEVEFTADKIGEFEFYCSVGDHREEGQVGTLIVTE